MAHKLQQFTLGMDVKALFADSIDNHGPNLSRVDSARHPFFEALTGPVEFLIERRCIATIAV